MIYICKYDGSTDSRTLLEAAGCLSISVKDEDREGLRWQKLRQRILAWMLLAYAMDTERGMKVGELDLCRTKHGKPYSRAYPDLFFNISHCDRACACVVSNEPAGIDVERRFSYQEKLMRQVCSEEERKFFEVWEANTHLKNKSEHEKNADENAEDKRTAEMQLQQLWSMKEAFVKMDGRGLGYGMRKADLAKLLPVREESWMELEQYGSFLVKSDEDCTLAVCRKRLREIKLTELSANIYNTETEAKEKTAGGHADRYAGEEAWEIQYVSEGELVKWMTERIDQQG